MFTNPWAIGIAVVAAGLPVVIHLLTRPKPVRMQLSTLRFVKQAVAQRRSRNRLRDFLVLLLRTLAVLLLGAAIARPLWQHSQARPVDQMADVVRVVILDTSQSMAARVSGVEQLERARGIAAAHLQWKSGLKVNLISAAANPRAVFASTATNFSAVREQLQSAEVRPEELDAQAAINMAAEMLAAESADGVIRELVIVSDCQRSNWATVDFGALPEDTQIALESVAPEQPAPNLGVLHVASTGRAEGGRDVAFEVVVGNYSATPREVTVSVSAGDASVQVKGLARPQARTTLTGILPESEPGWQTGEARLVRHEDSLSADDVRPWVMSVAASPTFVLLTREPESRKPSSSFLVQRALEALVAATARDAVRRMDVAKFDSETAASGDVIVMDHPGLLDEATVSQLVTLSRRGRGILYIASESVDATNLVRLLQASGGNLNLPVEFQPMPAGRFRRDASLGEIRNRRPPFPMFGDELPVLLSELKFAGGLDTREVPDQLQDDVLARYADRTAFLVTSAGSGGGLVVLNADLGRSNLPASPMFVPLLDEVIRNYLLGSSRQSLEQPCGRPFVRSLTSRVDSAAGLNVERRAVASAAWSVSAADLLRQESSGVSWLCDAAPGPGLGRVLRGDVVVAASASVIPGSESDLRSLSGEVFEERLAGQREVKFRSTTTGGDGDRNDNAWSWLLVVGVLCLIGEVVVLKLFGT